MENKANKQAQIDARAIREKKAVGADDMGGQDYTHPGQRVKSDQHGTKPKFRGITHAN